MRNRHPDLIHEKALLTGLPYVRRVEEGHRCRPNLSQAASQNIFFYDNTDVGRYYEETANRPWSGFRFMAQMLRVHSRDSHPLTEFLCQGTIVGLSQMVALSFSRHFTARNTPFKTCWSEFIVQTRLMKAMGVWPAWRLSTTNLSLALTLLTGRTGPTDP